MSVSDLFLYIFNRRKYEEKLMIKDLIKFQIKIDKANAYYNSLSETRISNFRNNTIVQLPLKPPIRMWDGKKLMEWEPENLNFMILMYSG
jgi:hypothetical protein